MAVLYFCRHCGYKIGEINEQNVSLERLGFHQLSDSERQEMVTHSENGDIKVKSICEHCEATLNQNPDYHQLKSFIH
ncbi:anti-sigma-F factor Fin family protein [Bacillus solimangrovi]|uniref:Peptide ABC transporter permease n=1 Tax=Bacillus solimangrovi TaxID=1305675 RepID=A0A1E5LEX5_9BACI|nr:anti-sigma-F factor Fin family protein [Bacillus solimangrovi]OEH92634.1 hypothetical protein BFG57_14800 [Bacillus solimangrovi]